MNTREVIQHELIKMVIRQTDYSEEEAIIKLKEHNNDYMEVIREAMGINKPKKNNDITSVNQQIYKEIRGMMDDAANNYRIKQEKQKLLERIYEEQKQITKSQD